jgi:hypothetical protein
MSNFHIGQRVVCCVADHDWKTVVWAKGEVPHRAPLSGTVPVHGQVYTVEKVIPADEWHDETAGLVLFEILSDECWDASAFRPIEEHRTDISVFTRMLTPSTESVP